MPGFLGAASGRGSRERSGRRRGTGEKAGPSRVAHMADKPGESDSTVLKPSEAQVKPPPMFQVVMYNDDYTPMEFVVEVLQLFFALPRERATQIMLKVHTEGRGVCGIYPKDVASTKVEQVTAYSRQHQHPLQCAMEET